MLKKLFTILSLILLSFITKAQSQIIGYAPEFIGNKVTLYTYSDYYTFSKVKLAETTVGKDSLFKLENPVKYTVKAILEIGKTEAEIYLMPKANYSLEYFKPTNEPIAFVNQKITPIFYNLDSLDVNARILKYNKAFDKYVYLNRHLIGKHGFKPYLDTFKILAYKAYGTIKEPYFLNYVRFNIALMEQVNNKKSKDKINKRLGTYMEYIKPYPVLHYNDQYMEFIKGFYPKDFNSYSTKIKSSVILAIDNQSPTRILNALKYDPYLNKPELREMVMINMLGKSYYKRTYNRKNLTVILDSVSRFSKYKNNAILAHNLINVLTNLEKGYPAPDLHIENDSGNVITMDNYRGRFVYINFFATWNQSSVNEMKLIKQLKQDYGEYISFISFSTDKTKAKLDEFKKENPTYDWEIHYVGENSDEINQYNVVTIPAYYLVGQDGFMALSPALGPAPNGVGESIEKTFRYIKTEMEK